MAIPVSLEDAKRQLRVELDDDEQDDEINGFIADAAAWVTAYTGHVFEETEVTEEFPSFKKLRLRAWPIKRDAAVAVSYSGVPDPITVAGARLQFGTERATVLPALSTSWPYLATGSIVSITVQAGYGEGDVVPGNLRRAMLVLIGAFYADREGGEVAAAGEETARRLCRKFKVHTL